MQSIHNDKTMTTQSTFITNDPFIHHKGAVASYSSRISELIMYLADDNDIISNSVLEVTNAETFQNNETPVSAGMYDPRLGSIAQLFTCITCGNDNINCPGHSGYFRMNHVVIQPLALDHVLKWLKVICLKCGGPMVNNAKLQRTPNADKLQVASESVTDGKQCMNPICGAIHGKIKQSEENPFIFLHGTGSDEIKMFPEDIKNIFEKISNETVLSYGRSILSHPKKYLVTVLVVSPISIRPYFRNMSSMKSHKMPPIVEFTKNIIKRSKIKGNDVDHIKRTLFLNRCVFDMIKGGVKGGSKDTNAIGGSPGDSVMKGLSGKHGDIRGKQFGHKALNSSRLTITGNAFLKLDEVGIPLYVISKLQISETVRNYNRLRLTNDLMMGRISRIKKYGSSNEKIINDTNISNVIFENGDIVYRRLYNGDMVNFNRQPSTIESSIGSHKAVLFETKTINTYQMNPCSCVGYGADFDGDQMCLKALRTTRARAEAEFLTPVSRWFLSHQYSNARNGQIQDSIIGSALLTKNNVLIDKLHAMRMFVSCRMDNYPKFTEKIYTGRSVVSLLLKLAPVSFKTVAKFYNESWKQFIKYEDDEIYVKIVHGKLITGVLDDTSISAGAGSLFHVISKEYDSVTAFQMIHYHQQLSIAYLNCRGFTMSLDDILLTKESEKMIDHIVSERITKSEQYARQYIRGNIYPTINMTKEQFYEEQQLNILSHVNDIFIPIFMSIDQPSNGLFQMVSHKSKGDSANLIKMMGYIGQIKLEGNRLRGKFSPYRTSIYFPRYAVNPESKGFVKGSYTRGLSHVDICMDSEEARDQLIQKSQTTAISGHMMRVHMKNLEGCMVNYLRQTIKSHMILQYLYGGDGVDNRYMIKDTFSTVFQSDDSIRKSYPKSTDTEIKQLISDRNIYRKFIHSLHLLGIYQYSDKMMVPLIISNVIDSVLHESGTLSDAGADIDTMRQMVSDYIKDFKYTLSNVTQKRRKSYIPDYFDKAVFLIKMMLQICLTTDTLLKLNKKILQIILDTITYKYNNTLIDPGIPVGILAVHAVCEPITQAFLSAIHGKSGDNKEKLNYIKKIVGAKEISNTFRHATIHLKGTNAYDESAVEKYASTIISATLDEFTHIWQIFFEKFANPVHPKYAHEKAMISSYLSKSPMEPLNISNWVIRIELDRRKMILKNVNLDMIVESLYNQIDNIYIVTSPETDRVIVLRIYITVNELLRVQNAEKYVTTTLLPRYLGIYIKGINDIGGVNVVKMPQPVSHPDGSLELKTEYVIKTDGFDFYGYMSSQVLETSVVDMDSIYVNDSLMLNEIYGIEVARNNIIIEISTMPGKAPGYKHLSLYADAMTWSGNMVAVDKLASKEKNRTCMLASMKNPGSVLSKACLMGIKDRVDESISSQIMLGTTPKLGTHYFNVCINEEFVASKTKGTLEILDDLLM